MHEVSERSEGVIRRIEYALNVILERHVALYGDRLASGFLDRFNDRSRGV